MRLILIIFSFADTGNTGLCRAWLAGLALVALLASAPMLAGDLNVYSARHYDSDELLYQRFTEQTGIRVRVLQADSDQLIQRIRREGAASPADVLLTVDAGRLWRAEEAGVLAPLQSEVLAARVPAHLRHPDGLWFGFSTRARVIFYNPEQIDVESVQRYEDLAEPRFNRRICVRSSGNVYNQSLLASLIAAHGAEAALAWTQGLVANLARPPQGGDTDQIRGVAAGECDIALANHYYYVRLAHSDNSADRAVADRVAVLFPNQDDRGAHVNVGGGGMVRGAPNPDNARRFLEYLASDDAQHLFAAGNFEFPVVAGVPLPKELHGWQHFRADTLDMTTLGRNNADALRTADRAGWR
jgi:iron(III) transport system substrate-binding protein